MPTPGAFHVRSWHTLGRTLGGVESGAGSGAATSHFPLFPSAAHSFATRFLSKKQRGRLLPISRPIRS